MILSNHAFMLRVYAVVQPTLDQEKNHCPIFPTNKKNIMTVTVRGGRIYFQMGGNGCRRGETGSILNAVVMQSDDIPNPSGSSTENGGVIRRRNGK